MMVSLVQLPVPVGDGLSLGPAVPSLTFHVPIMNTYPLADRMVPAGQLIPLSSHLCQQVLQPGQLLLQELTLLLHLG